MLTTEMCDEEKRISYKNMLNIVPVMSTYIALKHCCKTKVFKNTAVITSNNVIIINEKAMERTKSTRKGKGMKRTIDQNDFLVITLFNRKLTLVLTASCFWRVHRHF